MDNKVNMTASQSVKPKTRTGGRFFTSAWFQLPLLFLALFALAFGVMPIYQLLQNWWAKTALFAGTVILLCALFPVLVGTIYRQVHGPGAAAGQPVFLRLTLALLVFLVVYVGLNFVMIWMFQLPIPAYRLQPIITWTSVGLTALLSPLMSAALFAALLDADGGIMAYRQAIRTVVGKAYFVLFLITLGQIGAGWLRDTYLLEGPLRQGITVLLSAILWTLSIQWLVLCIRPKEKAHAA